MGAGSTHLLLLRKRRKPRWSPRSLGYSQFAARLTTPPTLARAQAYDRLIYGLEQSSIWDKLDALYLFAAADAATAVLNLKSASYPCVPTNGPTFTADAGYASTNDATKYLATGFDPTVGTNQFTRDSGCLFARKGTNPADDGGGLIGGAGNVYVLALRADGVFYGASSGAGTTASAVSNNTGLFGVSRGAADVTRLYAKGVLVKNQGSSASAALTASKPFRILTDYTQTDPSNCQIQAAGFGANLTSAEWRTLDAYLANYIEDLAGSARGVQMLNSVDITNDGANNFTPGIGRLADGRLLAVYCVGSGNQQDGKIVYKTSSDNGATWSAASDLVTAVASHTYTDASVCVLASGKIIVSAMLQANDASTIAVKVFTGTTSGGAITWSSAIAVGSAATAPATTSYPLALANGQVMLGIYWYLQQKISVMFSSDEGATWGGEVIVNDGTGHSGITEANYVQLASGRIVGMVRDDTAAKVGFWRTYSDDNGATWSALSKVIDDSLTSAPSRPAMCLTPSGGILFMSRFIGSAGTQETGYTFSTDGGLTWSTPAIYFNATGYTYGSHISAQLFYDATMASVMGIIGVGSFNVAQMIFQRWYAP